MLAEEIAGAAPRENLVNMTNATDSNSTCAVKPTTASSRAEARRRRILENSAARLARITGKPEEEPILKNECCPEILSNIPSIDTLDDASVFYHDRLDLVEEPSLSSFQPLENSSQSETLSDFKKQKSFTDVFVESRLHIPIICIVIQALYMSNNVIDAYLFLPLFLWEVLELFCFQVPTKMPAISFLIPMLGLNSFLREALLLFLRIFINFSSDALLYVFTAVTMQFFVSLTESSR